MLNIWVYDTLEVVYVFNENFHLESMAVKVFVFTQIAAAIRGRKVGKKHIYLCDTSNPTENSNSSHICPPWVEITAR